MLCPDYPLAPHLPHFVYQVPSLCLTRTHMCGFSAEPHGWTGRLAAAILARSAARRSSRSSMRLRSV